MSLNMEKWKQIKVGTSLNYEVSTKGITPDYLKEKLPANKKRCTSCKKVLAIKFFDEYKTSRGNLSKRAKCQKCYKEYKAFHDAKYRRKL